MKRQIAVLVLILSVLVYMVVTVDSRGADSQGSHSNGTDPGQTIARKAFAGWTKPKAALFVTGRQNGYIEPCGCTGLENQKGGLARRDSLLKRFIDKKWNIAPVDVGNQVRRTGVQPERKFQATLQALSKMNYQAAGFGPDDLKLSSTEIIQNIVANANDSGKTDLFVSSNIDILEFVPTYRVLNLGDKKIGLTTILGSQYIKEITNDEINVTDPAKALETVVPKLVAEKCDYLVLLSYAPVNECEELARKFDVFDVIVTAGGFGEPKYIPDSINGSKSLLIQTGDKGMYVGIVGFFDDPTEPIKYQKLVLDKKFKDSPQMLEVMREYQNNLKQTIISEGLKGLGIAPVAHPSGKEFVGSQVCGECHTQAYAKWLETPHSHATDSIVKPPERSEIPRHFDPECLSCHVTGWNPQQYYPYKTGYVDLEKSKLLHGNGCENCHGPGSEHVNAENGGNFTDEQIADLRKSMRVTLNDAELSCMECHDLDNSPDFHKEGAFSEYWEAIKHPGMD